MSIERDKFLTERMGECWHEGIHPLYKSECRKCGWLYTQNTQTIHTNFSTWEGFGKLLPFAEQEMGIEKIFYSFNNCWPFDDKFCSKFADVLYIFLKERSN